MFTVPLRPSLVAVTVTAPGATPDTSPLADTEARLASLLLQVTARSPSTAPAVLRTAAVSCNVVPAVNEEAGEVTVTLPTGAGVMVSEDVAETPSVRAVMTAVPGEMATTIPVPATVARDGSEELHVTKRSASVVPREPRTAAV
jgi:hypothetical protein